MMTATILDDYFDQANELLELTEDLVSFYCSEYCVSGERAWDMLRGMSEAKLDQYPDY